MENQDAENTDAASRIDGSSHDDEVHPAHLKADYASKNIPEVAKLYRSLGMRSYFDGKYLNFYQQPHEGYDPDRTFPEEIERKKAELDDVLWNLLFNEIESSPKWMSFKTASIELAKSYCSYSWMHNNWLTSKILTQLIDSELVPLKSESSGLAMPNTLLSALPAPWGSVIWIFFSIVQFGFLGLVALGLALSEYSAWSLPVVGYMLWSLFFRIRVSINLRKHQEHLSSLCAGLALVRDEAASGCFDSKELATRLRRLEEKGLYVHSLVHALLRLPASTPTPANHHLEGSPSEPEPENW